MAQRLLRALTPLLDRETLVADLDEEFETSQLAASGVDGARDWYWRQVRNSLPPIVAMRLRAGALGALTFVVAFCVLLTAAVFLMDWWTLPGPILMILMFYAISIPMIDKRMLRRRTGYREYLKRTSGLIPMPQKKISDTAFTILK